MSRYIPGFVFFVVLCGNHKILRHLSSNCWILLSLAVPAPDKS
jgi:hypothetical protein